MLQEKKRKSKSERTDVTGRQAVSVGAIVEIGEKFANTWVGGLEGEKREKKEGGSDNT